MEYYLNHYAHKLTKERQFRGEWLKSKEEFLISSSALMVPYPPLNIPPVQTRALHVGQEEVGGKKKKKK